MVGIALYQAISLRLGTLYLEQDLPAMGGGVHISPVLNLDGFMGRLHEPPELSLKVILRNSDVANTIDHRVIWLEYV
jgi:hypothetical protein